jgi:threonine synthase
MIYHSTNATAPPADLKEAVIRSLPPDNGLYMPERLPRLGEAFWKNWRSRSFVENSAALAAAFFGEDVPRAELERIVAESLTFPAPVVEPAEGRRVLELFHGPTLAFKDFGARFMARLMAWLTRDDERGLTVLVATSGDTGGAVANAFHRVEGTRVVILYPKGKVSGLQEKQLTTLGDNIEALEIDGSFDDCQRMVKAALLDRSLVARLNLTSANSINIARLVPQCFYYLEAARQLPEGTEPVFVVPSGNFGNLTAGLLAARAGLPVRRFVAATNVNDVVPRFLADGRYQPRPTIPTISNAMDVGAPSNFARLSDLFGADPEAMRAEIAGFAFGDAATRATIRRVRESTGYVLDPHGAVGWLAAEAWLENHPGDATVVLATAHPAKFPEVIAEELGARALEIPERLACLAQREKHALPMPADESAFIDWLAG